MSLNASGCCTYIYKNNDNKKGNRTMSNNYRGITLLCWVPKLQEQISENRVKKETNSQLNQAQSGSNTQY